MTRAALRAPSFITGNVAHSCFQWRIVASGSSLFRSTPLEGTRHGRGITYKLKTATDLFKFINRDFKYYKLLSNLVYKFMSCHQNYLYNHSIG
jgi:hypothetical protein